MYLLSSVNITYKYRNTWWATREAKPRQMLAAQRTHTQQQKILKKIMKITLTYVARSIHHQFMSDPQIQLFTSALIIINRERKKETFC